MGWGELWRMLCRLFFTERTKREISNSFVCTFLGSRTLVLIRSENILSFCCCKSVWLGVEQGERGHSFTFPFLCLNVRIAETFRCVAAILLQNKMRLFCFHRNGSILTVVCLLLVAKVADVISMSALRYFWDAHLWVMVVLGLLWTGFSHLCLFNLLCNIM